MNSSLVNMPTPLLLTKLQPPHLRPDFVPRPEPTHQIDTAIQHGRRLIMVSAPAGYGKTTLVNAWCRQNAEHVAWFALDEQDNAPRRFLTYLIAALQQTAPALDIATEAQIETGFSEQQTVVTLLVNQLATLSSSVTLVLDDYHLIEQPEIHDTVTFLIDNLPPQLQLVFTTRTEPPLPLARWHARNQLTVIDATQLCFSLDEATTFLYQSAGLSLDTEEIERLHQQTEGWAAGLQLAGLSLQRHGNVTAAIRRLDGSQRHIFDYLAHEVLRQQSVAMQTFLLRTAILDRFCGSLVNAVIDTKDGQAMLEELEAANLFILPLDDRRQWYRYHHLFADFLRKELERHYATDLPTLHCRAATWLEEHRFLSEAMDHLLQAGAYPDVAQFILRHTDTVLKQEELSLLLAWFGELPNREIEAVPALAVLYGWLLFVFGYIDATTHYLQIAEKDLQTHQTADNQHTRGMIALVQASLAEETERQIALAQQALQWLDADRPFWRSIGYHVLGNAHQESGAVKAATDALRNAIHCGALGGNRYIETLAQNSLDALQQSSVAPSPATSSTQSLIEPLTAREREVLHCLADGLSNQEIAATLVIALPTVKRHANNIYGKLHVRSRTAAVARARELGLLTHG